MKEEKLIEACSNLTAVLGLDPQIGTDSKKQMKKDLVEAAKLITPGDLSALHKDTVSVLKELGVSCSEEKKAKKAKKEKKEKKTEETEETAELEGKKGKKERKTEEPEKKEKKEKGERKEGVISTIISLIKKGPITKEKILKELERKFPERNVDGMKKTLHIQLGGRLAREKNLKIENTEKGYKIK